MSEIHVGKKRKISDTLVKIPGGNFGGLTHSPPQPASQPASQKVRYFSGKLIMIRLNLPEDLDVADAKMFEIAKYFDQHPQQLKYMFCRETGKTGNNHVQGWVQQPEQKKKLDHIKGYVRARYPEYNANDETKPMASEIAKKPENLQRYVCKEDHQVWVSNFHTVEERQELHRLYWKLEQEKIQKRGVEFVEVPKKRKKAVFIQITDIYDNKYQPVSTRNQSESYKDMPRSEAAKIALDKYEQVSMMSGYNVVRKCYESLLLRYNQEENDRCESKLISHCPWD